MIIDSPMALPRYISPRGGPQMLSIYQVIFSVTTETVLSSKARPEHICRMTIRSLPLTASVIIFCNQTNPMLVLPLNWTPLSLWNDFSCIATSS